MSTIVSEVIWKPTLKFHWHIVHPIEKVFQFKEEVPEIEIGISIKTVAGWCFISAFV